MAVNVNKDRAVVVISKNSITTALGYSSLHAAIATVEGQCAKPELAFDVIVEAMDKGTTIDDVTYRIMDVEIYLDTYEDYDES